MLLQGESSEEHLTSAWASLTFAELRSLKEHLDTFFEELAEGDMRPGWHCHIGDGRRELTIEALDPATGYNVTPEMAEVLERVKAEDLAAMGPIPENSWLEGPTDPPS